MTPAEHPATPAPLDKRLVALGLLVVLIAVGLSLSTVLMVAKGDPDKIEKLEQAWMKAEAATHERLVQEGKRQGVYALATVARQQWVGLAARAEKALTALEVLPQTASQWNSTMAELSHDDEGRQLAAAPELLGDFDALTSKKAPPPLDVDALDVARTALVSAKEAAKNAVEVDSLQDGPPVALVDQVSFAARTVEDLSGVYASAFGKLKKLKERSSLEPAPANGRTLAEALEEYRTEQKQQEYEQFLNAFRETTEGAKESIRQAAHEGAQSITDARIDGIKEIAASLLKQEVARNDAAAKKIRQEHEAEMTAAEQKVAEAQALSDAAAAENQRRREAIEAAAKKKALVARCHEAAVQQALAPFLSKGYYQPGTKALAREQAPMSYAALQAVGALTPTASGVGKLLQVASNPNSDRKPLLEKLPYIENFDLWFQRNPTRYEEGKKLQALLNELGPTLVEEKLLSP